MCTLWEYTESNCVSLFCQSLSPQMIILRVAMGHGWLKETADEISATPVFAAPAMIDA